MDTNTRDADLLRLAMSLIGRFRDFTEWEEMAFDLHLDHDELKALVGEVEPFTAEAARAAVRRMALASARA